MADEGDLIGSDDHGAIIGIDEGGLKGLCIDGYNCILRPNGWKKKVLDQSGSEEN